VRACVRTLYYDIESMDNSLGLAYFFNRIEVSDINVSCFLIVRVTRVARRRRSFLFKRFWKKSILRPICGDVQQQRATAGVSDRRGGLGRRLQMYTLFVDSVLMKSFDFQLRYSVTSPFTGLSKSVRVALHTTVAISGIKAVLLSVP